MLSFQSYRSLQGQKWLRAFLLIREKRKTSSCWNALQHMLINRHYHQIPSQVYFSSASRSKTQNFKKLTEGKTENLTEEGLQGRDSERLVSLITENVVKDGIYDRDSELTDDQYSLDDIVLTDNVSFPWKKKLKRYDRQLSECLLTIQEAQKPVPPISIQKLLPPTFPRIVAFSLNQSVPFALREKCLRLVLMQDVDDKLTVKLLTQTLEDSQHLSMDILMDIIQKISVSKPTELRLNVRKDFVAHIVNKRFHEIGQKHLLSIMYQLDELFDMKIITKETRGIYRTVKKDMLENIQFFEKDVDTSSYAGIDAVYVPVWSLNLERRILDIVDEIKTKDLARILMLMGKWKSRNQTLLAAVIHRLCLADLSDLRYIQLANVLFACSSLTLHNRILLDKITKLLSSHPPFSPSLTISVLAYLSHLRWYDPEFVSKCLLYSGEHISELSGKETCSILMSLANLYAFPSPEEHRNVTAALGKQALLSNLSDVDTVNVVWSLAILQSLTTDQAELVLEPSFVKRFHDTSRFQNRSCLQKLQQISAAAKLELSSFTESNCATDADLSLRDAHSHEGASKSEQELKSTLMNSLRKFVNLSTHIKGGEQLPQGLTVDALMCAEADGSFKPVFNLEEKFEDSEKKLHRLAIKVIPFKGVIHPQKRPTGVYQMEARHLKAMGYTLVPILYSDLHKNKSNLEHVTAIQQQIKESIIST